MTNKKGEVKQKPSKVDKPRKEVKYHVCDKCSHMSEPDGGAMREEGHTFVHKGITKRTTMSTEQHAPVSEERCHDCSVLVGEVHHEGCDVEECPKCHVQIITCGCKKTWKTYDDRVEYGNETRASFVSNKPVSEDCNCMERERGNHGTECISKQIQKAYDRGYKDGKERGEEDSTLEMKSAEAHAEYIKDEYKKTKA